MRSHRHKRAASEPSQSSRPAKKARDAAVSDGYESSDEGQDPASCCAPTIPQLYGLSDLEDSSDHHTSESASPEMSPVSYPPRTEYHAPGGSSSSDDGPSSTDCYGYSHASSTSSSAGTPSTMVFTDHSEDKWGPLGERIRNSDGTEDEEEEEEEKEEKEEEEGDDGGGNKLREREHKEGGESNGEYDAEDEYEREEDDYE